MVLQVLHLDQAWYIVIRCTCLMCMPILTLRHKIQYDAVGWSAMLCDVHVDARFEVIQVSSFGLPEWPH